MSASREQLSWACWDGKAYLDKQTGRAHIARIVALIHLRKRFTERCIEEWLKIIRPSAPIARPDADTDL